MPTEATKWDFRKPAEKEFKFLEDDSFSTKEHCCKSCEESGVYDTQLPTGGLAALRVALQGSSGFGGRYITPKPTYSTGGGFGGGLQDPLPPLPPPPPGGGTSVGKRKTKTPAPPLSPPWPWYPLPQPGLGERIRKLIERPEIKGHPPRLLPPGLPRGPARSDFDIATKADLELTRRRLRLFLWILWSLCRNRPTRPKSRICTCIKHRGNPKTFGDFIKSIESIGGTSYDCRSIKRTIEKLAHDLEYVESGLKPPPIPPLPPLPPPHRDPPGYVTPRMSAKPKPTPLSLENDVNLILRMATGDPQITWRDFHWPECKKYPAGSLSFWKCMAELAKTLFRLLMVKEEGRRRRGQLRSAGDELNEWMRKRTRQFGRAGRIRRSARRIRRAGSK